MPRKEASAGRASTTGCVDALLLEEQQLEARLAEIRRLRSADVEERPAGPTNVAPVLGAAPDASPDGARRPVRAFVLDGLDDLDWMAYSGELRLYLKARYGREIQSTRFGTLSKDEARGFDSKRPQAVYLAHGLTADRFEPIKRLWGRSDWPLEKRIVAPTTGRVQHLKMTVRLCEIAAAADGVAADPEMLRIIAADHARDVPNVRVQRGRFELERWRSAASELVAELEPRDVLRRKEAAEQLRTRSERQQLFGVEMFVIDGGTSLPAAKEG